MMFDTHTIMAFKTQILGVALQILQHIAHIFALAETLTLRALRR